MNWVSEEPLLLTVWRSLINDSLAILPQYRRDLLRDVRRVEERTACEGLGFLTKVLPAWGYQYLRWLDGACSGDIPNVPGWSPHFMRWAIHGVTSECRLQVVTLATQLTMLGAKYHDSADEAVRIRCLSEFEIRAVSAQNPAPEPIIDSMRSYLSRLLGPAVFDEFSHGSGATFHKERLFRAESVGLCFQSEEVFPSKEIFFFSFSHAYSHLVLSRAQSEYRSRIVTVPKTSSSVRVIAVEQAQAMFLQQAIMRRMYRRLRRVGCDLRNQSEMHDQIRFRDVGTIDLTAASDSVALDLIDRIFPSDWATALLSCRSNVLDFGDHTIRPTMYATMGNATTFPVMTAVFLALMHAYDVPCKVYGDDIIVPTSKYEVAWNALLDFGFHPNRKKSYNGLIRESCGLLLFEGEDVTPTYLRDVSSTANGFASRVACANQFVSKWYMRTAELLFVNVESVLGPLPATGSREVGFLSRSNPRFEILPCEMYGKKRWDKNIHAWRFRAPYVRIVGASAAPTSYSDPRLYAETLATSKAPALVKRGLSRVGFGFFALA